MAVATDLGIEHDIVKYMLVANGPDRATIEAIVAGLEDPVEDLVRKDSLFKKLDLDADALVGNAELVVDTLVEHPKLLQRPVLTRADGRSIIGRPKDRIAPFLQGG